MAYIICDRDDCWLQEHADAFTEVCDLAIWMTRANCNSFLKLQQTVECISIYIRHKHYSSQIDLIGFYHIAICPLSQK